MERGSVPRTTEITNRGSGWSFLGVLIVLTITVIIVAIVILYMNSNRDTNQITETQQSECLTNFDCSSGSVCDPESRTCVECFEDGNCSTEKPFCNTETSTCQGCNTDSDCPTSKPTCDENEKICIECTTSSDCSGAEPICEPVSRTCVACAGNSDCSSLQPFCSNFTCRECIDNSQCVTGTCNGGICCDLTAPTIIDIIPVAPPPPVFPSTTVQTPPPEFLITYSFTQPLSVLNGVILFISDDKDNDIFTTPIQPATGSLTFSSPFITLPALFYTFEYKFRLQLITSCGPTLISASSTSIYPIPVGPNVLTPVITSGLVNYNGSGQAVNFELRVNNRFLFLGSGCVGTWRAFYSTDETFEPNAAESDLNTQISECVVFPGDNSLCELTGTCKLIIQFSSFVSPGTTYWIRVANANPVTNPAPVNYVTPAFPLTIAI